MKTRANGIDIHYTIDGSGPWLTMSHSLACDSRMWDEQVAILSKRFRVLRFDTRGHGQTQVTTGAYTLDLLAEDAAGLLAELGVKETHWIGISMGAMIGQTLALKKPGLLKSLVLADTTSRNPPEVWPMWKERIDTAESKGMEPLVEPTLARWFTAPYLKARPDRVKPIADMIRATPVAGYAGCCHALPKINLTDRLKEIKAPVLALTGAEDASAAATKTIHESIPGSDFVSIPSASHIANVEQPEAFNAALTKFYDRILK
ncbi:MAG TPA: alpha/beta fold hydrolase [Burkholderiales bacterium]|nr:alpha/beta fold hydrolase [Burkholderiales bacterium]